MNKVLVISFLVLFNLDALCIFPDFNVEYIGGGVKNKENLRRLVESTAESLKKIPSGLLLINKINELLHNVLSAESKILICYGSETKFSPSDLTGSPPRATLTEESLIQQELLMREKDELISAKSSVLIGEKDLIKESYKSLFEKEPTKTEKVKFQYNCIKKELSIHPEKAVSERIIEVIKKVDDLDLKEKAIEEKLKQLTEDTAKKTKKSKDLTIVVDEKEGSDTSYAPGCILVESELTLVAPVISGFVEQLAHELIHMKHYLEEQFFKVKSLREIAKLVVKPDSADFVVFGFTSEEDAFSKLMESSAIRSGVFYILKERIPGDGDLIWTMSDSSSLKLLAYSVAGEGIKMTDNITVLPEAKYRKMSLVRNIIGDLEERRTVLGPDRDGITENVIRREMGLPLRYIYQDAVQPIFESNEVIAEILGKSDITYIQANSERWLSENKIEIATLEVYKKQARDNPLSHQKSSD